MSKKWPKPPKWKPGKDTAQVAIWISDSEPPAKIMWWKAEEAPRRLRESADAAGVTLGPITWRELQPGQEDAGHPPDGVQGDNVRLLVAEAEVTGHRPQIVTRSFMADLDPKDLARLRAITVRAALPHVITEAEADAVIERFGPAVAEKVLKELVDGRA